MCLRLPSLLINVRIYKPTMDNVNANKRKKLKTRKNLDQLRRKSHGETTKNGMKSDKCGLPNKINKFLTSQRLTLALNKKAVQSKTILRSNLRTVQETPKSDETLYQCASNVNNLSDVEEFVLNKSDKPTEKFTKADSICKNPASFSQSRVQNAAESMASIIERDFSDEDELAKALLQHISNYVIPNVNVEGKYSIDVFLKPSMESMNGNFQSVLSQHEIKRQTEVNSLVLQVISDESEDSDQNDIVLSSESHTHSDNNISPVLMLMESNVRDSPVFEFYPHRLNH